MGIKDLLSLWRDGRRIDQARRIKVADCLHQFGEIAVRGGQVALAQTILRESERN